MKIGCAAATFDKHTANLDYRHHLVKSNNRPAALRQYPWLQIECSRCKTPRDVDMAARAHPPTTCVHDLVSRLRAKCKKAGKRPLATLLQIAALARHAPA